MTMTRRQFAQGLGAGVVLLPFLQGAARASSTLPPRRLFIMTSLGTVPSLWTPKSAPGSPVVLQQMTQPLQSILPNLVMVDGLSFLEPQAGHSTPQTLTGHTSNTAFTPSVYSVDQYIARKLGPLTKLPTFMLGWKGVDEGHSFAGGSRLPPIDSPLNAWQAAFGAAAPTPPAQGGLPRKSILDLVSRQVRQMQGSLGSHSKARLDEHLASIAQLEASMGATQLPTGCTAPGMPSLHGADPEADASTIVVAQNHADLIATALTCDVTRIAGMQWGVSNRQYMGVPGGNYDEHSLVHGGDNFTQYIIAVETYLSQWFTDLALRLQNTPDPSAPGTSVFDNTLMVWTRDISDGPNHKQYSMNYVLAGATGYLPTQPTGTYLSYGGNDAASVTGQPHQRLLLNLCEWMGVSDASDFGTLSAYSAAQRKPLPDLRR